MVERPDTLSQPHCKTAFSAIRTDDQGGWRVLYASFQEGFLEEAAFELELNVGEWAEVN